MIIYGFCQQKKKGFEVSSVVNCRSFQFSSVVNCNWFSSSAVNCRRVFSSFTCVSQPNNMCEQQFSIPFDENCKVGKFDPFHNNNNFFLRKKIKKIIIIVINNVNKKIVMLTPTKLI